MSVVSDTLGSMTQNFEQIVIGGGAMGLATAWQLAQRGVRTLLLEQFEFGHDLGASHGAARNLNNAYLDDSYLDLYDLSLSLYRELESASSTKLLTMAGLVTMGPDTRITPVFEKLSARGAPVEWLDPEEATRRWPGIQFDDRVLLSHQAGRIASAQVLEALRDQAVAYGADLRDGMCVTSVQQTAAGVSVSAVDTSGETLNFTADGAVVTVGAWTTKLLGTQIALPQLTVTEEHPAHFQPAVAFAEADWPSFNHLISAHPETGTGDVYGMLTPGEGVKVGFHCTGDEVDPDARAFRGSERNRDALRAHVTRYFPGLDPKSATEISCTYTTSAEGNFILDRRGSITFGAGFAGEGFKFVPAIGKTLADIALGTGSAAAVFQLQG